MSLRHPLPVATNPVPSTPNRLRLAAAGLGLLAVVAAAPHARAGETTLKAGFAVSISGIPIGRAEMVAKFNDNGTYAATVNGSTFGLSRLVSDARAEMAGTGTIAGQKIVPASYNLTSREGSFESSVAMGMRDRAIVQVDAKPTPKPDPTRIPLTAASKRGVVDPLGAFVVVLDNPDKLDGRTVCNRKMKVFDGWERFDVAFSYKETKRFTGGGGSYSGKVIACKARYIPVAGHTKNGGNAALLGKAPIEVWLAPVKGTNLMVPITFVVGTEYGVVVARARSFQVVR